MDQTMSAHTNPGQRRFLSRLWRRVAHTAELCPQHQRDIALLVILGSLLAILRKAPSAMTRND